MLAQRCLLCAARTSTGLQGSRARVDMEQDEPLTVIDQLWAKMR